MSNALLNELLTEAEEVANVEDMDSEIEAEDEDVASAEEANVEDDMDEDDEVLTEEEFDAIEEAALETYAMALNQMGDDYLSESELLSEQKNIVRLNRQSRLLNMTNRTAIVMARKSNDNLYKKYAKFNALRLQYRAAIVKKYGSKAASYARKLLSRSAPKK